MSIQGNVARGLRVGETGTRADDGGVGGSYSGGGSSGRSWPSVCIYNESTCNVGTVKSVTRETSETSRLVVCWCGMWTRRSKTDVGTVKLFRVSSCWKTSLTKLAVEVRFFNVLLGKDWYLGATGPIFLRFSNRILCVLTWVDWPRQHLVRSWTRTFANGPR